jgi:hypothetical protein
MQRHVLTLRMWMRSFTGSCYHFLKETLSETQPRRKQNVWTEKLWNSFVMAARTMAKYRPFVSIIYERQAKRLLNPLRGLSSKMLYQIHVSIVLQCSWRKDTKLRHENYKRDTWHHTTYEHPHTERNLMISSFSTFQHTANFIKFDGKIDAESKRYYER